MAAFPRTIKPRNPSAYAEPGPLVSLGHTGKRQYRSTMQIGRVWSEEFAPKDATDPAWRALVATIESGYRSGTQFDVDHMHYQTKNGGGTGAPLVNGVNQTGGTLNTDAWTGANPVLKAGDLIRIAGITNAFKITVDAPNLAAGATALSIHPPIFAGGSPADNAAITHVAPILFKARILAFEPGVSGPDGILASCKITWAEDV